MYLANVSISFLTDGDRTVFEGAYHSSNFPAVRATGSSSREPGDKSDVAVGEALAAARFLRSLAAKLEKQANGTVKHREDIKAHRAQIAAAVAAAARAVREDARLAVLDEIVPETEENPEPPQRKRIRHW